MPQTDQTPDLLPNYDGTYNSYYPGGDKPEPPPEPEPGEPPVITGVTGTIAQGETITITGSNFSTYRSSTLFFTDFSEGEIGESVVDAIEGIGGTAGIAPKNYLFSDDRPLVGSRVAKATADGVAPGNIWVDFPPTAECFVEFTHRVTKQVWAEIAGAQFKTSRLCVGPGHGDGPYLGIIEQNYNAVTHPKGQPTVTLNIGDTKQRVSYPYAEEGLGTTYNEGEWYRNSLYMKLSDPDVANGEWWYRTSLRNNWKHYVAPENVPVFATADSWSEPPSLTRTSDKPDALLRRMYLPWYTKPGQSVVCDLGYAYVNDSRERVMLSTSPVVTASVDYHHVCCPTITKTSGEIQTKLLLDALPSNEPVYLYVFNHDGAVNENGYLIREAQ